jgi:hypothetical protein
MAGTFTVPQGLRRQMAEETPSGLFPVIDAEGIVETSGRPVGKTERRRGG